MSQDLRFPSRVLVMMVMFLPTWQVKFELSLSHCVYGTGRGLHRFQLNYRWQYWRIESRKLVEAEHWSLTVVVLAGLS